MNSLRQLHARICRQRRKRPARDAHQVLRRVELQVQRVWDSPGLDMARTGIDNIGRS